MVPNSVRAQYVFNLTLQEPARLVIIMTMKRKLDGDYVRSSFFGIEDSLVSTTGLIAGVAVGSHDTKFVILAGLVGIAVEAVSMGAGEFLSEETEHDLDKNDRANPLTGGLIMLISYFLAGLIPLLPIILLPPSISLYVSIFAALVGLFVLGIAKGKVTNRSMLKSAVKVLIVGGIAAGIGIAVGIMLRPQ